MSNEKTAQSISEIVQTTVTATAIGSLDQIARIRSGEDKRGFRYFIASGLEKDEALQHGRELARMSNDPILVIELPS